MNHIEGFDSPHLTSWRAQLLRQSKDLWHHSLITAIVAPALQLSRNQSTFLPKQVGAKAMKWTLPILNPQQWLHNLKK